MRRKDREITGREDLEAVLQRCRTCRLAMTAEGWPYVIPLNFGYTWGEDGLTLYFHSGIKGKKLDALRADPRVCFEMDTEDGRYPLPVQLCVFFDCRLRPCGVCAE